MVPLSVRTIYALLQISPSIYCCLNHFFIQTLMGQKTFWLHHHFIFLRNKQKLEKIMISPPSKSVSAVCSFRKNPISYNLFWFLCIWGPSYWGDASGPCFISQKQNVGKPSFPASTLTLKVLDQGSAVHISASIKWRERNAETGELWQQCA